MKRLLFIAVVCIAVGAVYHQDIENTITDWANNMANQSAPAGVGVAGAAGELGNAVGNTFEHVGSVLNQ